MKSALITINAGNVLCNNARASFRAAADRWGVDYREIIPGQNVPMMNPLVCKMRLFELSKADRIFYVDGSDILIRSDTPSPFDMCPPSDLGVVPDHDKSSSRRVFLAMQSDWARVNRALSQSLKMSRPHFNAGVMLVSRAAHQKVFDRAYEIYLRVRRSWSFVDQTALNHAATELKAPLCLFDRTWNNLVPGFVVQWAWMEHYIYHFAGSSQRHTTLRTLNWQAPTAELQTSSNGDAHCRSTSRSVRMFSRKWFIEAFAYLPLLGPLLRYFYCLATLPLTVYRMPQRIDNIEAMLRGMNFDLAEMRSDSPSHKNT